MIFKKIRTSSTFFLLLVSFACSSDPNSSGVSIGELFEVTITTPIDADRILNRVEANAVVVNGTSTIEDGSTLTVSISDEKNIRAKW